MRSEAKTRETIALALTVPAVVAGLVALGTALAAAPAAAAAGAGAAAAKPPVRVFVNGVDYLSLAGIRGRTFEGAKVVFDAAGDVHIALPGVKVDAPPGGSPTVAGTAAPKGPATAGKSGTATGVATPSGRVLSPEVAAIPLRFYLVTEVSRPGYAGFDLEVWVNDAYIGMIKNEDGAIAVDVHAHMKYAGKNTLRFKATKRPAAERRSSSASDFVKVILSEGRLVGGAVIPETRLFEFTKTAAEVASGTSEHVVDIKR